jgi:hypothetical protein
VSHALLRKISAEWTHRRPRGRTESRERLKRRLLDCFFTVELAARDLRANVGELSSIVPGNLLLRGSVKQPASLLVAGIEMFRAASARAGDVRAAQLISATLNLHPPAVTSEANP